MSDSDTAVGPRSAETGFAPRHVTTMPVFGEEWGELLAVAGHTPSAASPLAREPRGKGPRRPRPPADVLDIAFLTRDPEEVFAYLGTLARPDRVVSVTVGAYDRTTEPRRIAFHRSAKSGPDLVGLREVTRAESEVIFPYGAEELAAWLVTAMRFGYQSPFSVFEIDGLTLEDVVVLLGVLDGHKASLARSLARRAKDPGSAISPAEVAEAIRRGCESADPRWLVSSLAAILAEGGHRLGAPPSALRVEPLGTEAVTAGVERLAARGDLELTDAPDRYELTGSILTMSSALFYWRQFVGVHDTRVHSDGEGGVAVRERLLVNFAAPAANWLLTEDGDGEDAQFSFRGASGLEVTSALTGLVEHQGGEPPPDWFYSPAAPTSIPEPEPDPEPEVTARPAFCTECGSPLEPGARFCEECGTAAG